MDDRQLKWVKREADKVAKPLGKHRVVLSEPLASGNAPTIWRMSRQHREKRIALESGHYSRAAVTAAERKAFETRRPAWEFLRSPPSTKRDRKTFKPAFGHFEPSGQVGVPPRMVPGPEPKGAAKKRLPGSIDLKASVPDVAVRGDAAARKLTRFFEGDSGKLVVLEVGHQDVADKAKAIVEGARRKDYGTPFENHTRTAAMWSAFLGIPITPQQVCGLNALQKFSRLAHSPDHEDSVVDVVGWMLNREECDRAAEDPKNPTF